MKWQDTPESSHISGIAYDRPTYTLFVEFKRTHIYAYKEVAPQLYKQFLESPSKGRYFNEVFRDINEYVKVKGGRETIQETEVRHKQLEIPWTTKHYKENSISHAVFTHA